MDKFLVCLLLVLLVILLMANMKKSEYFGNVLNLSAGRKREKYKPIVKYSERPRENYMGEQLVENMNTHYNDEKGNFKYSGPMSKHFKEDMQGYYGKMNGYYDENMMNYDKYHSNKDDYYDEDMMNYDSKYYQKMKDDKYHSKMNDDNYYDENMANYDPGVKNFHDLRGYHGGVNRKPEGFNSKKKSLRNDKTRNDSTYKRIARLNGAKSPLQYVQRQLGTTIMPYRAPTTKVQDIRGIVLPNSIKDGKSEEPVMPGRKVTKVSVADLKQIDDIPSQFV